MMRPRTEHIMTYSYEDSTTTAFLDLEINDTLYRHNRASSRSPIKHQKTTSTTTKTSSGAPFRKNLGRNAVPKYSAAQTNRNMSSDEITSPKRPESHESFGESSDVVTYVADCGDDSAIDIADIWLATEEINDEKTIPPNKEPMLKTEKLEETINPRTKEAIAMIKALPQDSTWNNFTYRDHTWSIVPRDLGPRVHRILEKLCHEGLDLYDAKYTLHPLTPEAIAKLQRCYVCSGTRNTDCSMHPGRQVLNFNEETKVMERQWTCCGSTEVPNRKSKRKPGCNLLDEHTLEDLEGLAAHYDFRETPSPIVGAPKRKAVVLDCEMGGSHFNRSELIWVSVVDFYTGETLMHDFVKPSTPILDWRTQYSGVSKNLASSLEAQNIFFEGWQQAREKLLNYIDSNTIIIGHALNNDLDQLRLIHHRVIDTALTIPRIIGKKHSVQCLSLELLDKVVQDSAHGHDCLEDTLSARELLIWCLRHPDEVLERTIQSQKQFAEINAAAAVRKANLATLKQELLGNTVPSDQWTSEQRGLLEQLLETGLKPRDIVAECTRLEQASSE